MAKHKLKRKIKIGKTKIKNECTCNWRHHAQASGGVYCLGFLGAAIYYISTATGFWNGVLGIIKAVFWPGFLVYALLKFVGA